MNGMNKKELEEYTNGWEWIKETYVSDPYAFNELKAKLGKWNGYDYFELAVGDFICNRPNRSKVVYDTNTIHKEAFNFVNAYDEDSMKMYLAIMLFVHSIVATVIYAFSHEFNLLIYILSFIIFVSVTPYVLYGVNKIVDILVKKVIKLIF